MSKAGKKVCILGTRTGHRAVLNSGLETLWPRNEGIVIVLRLDRGPMAQIYMFPFRT